MGSDRKKELKNAYKARPVVGGICLIRCSGNQRSWLQATNDVESLRNRFNFSVAIKSAPDPSMHNEWLQYGSDSFSFTVLEELQRGDEQTDREFSDDIGVLYEFWLEKHEKGEL